MHTDIDASLMYYFRKKVIIIVNNIMKALENQI